MILHPNGIRVQPGYMGNIHQIFFVYAHKIRIIQQIFPKA